MKNVVLLTLVFSFTSALFAASDCPGKAALLRDVPVTADNRETGSETQCWVKTNDCPRKILVYNEDDSQYFMLHANKDWTPTLDEAGLRAYVRRIARGGKVTHFFMCPNAQNANWDSKVMSPEWAFERRPGQAARGGTFQRNLKKLHDAGIDPYAIWSDEARKGGLSPWLSIRMNDIHDGCDTNSTIHSDFWLAHPEFRRMPLTGDQFWQELALDYSHREVRDYMIRFLEEAFSRYDVDGVELDWMRAGFHLTPGKARSQSACLDEVVAAARRFATRAAARLGHPVKVGVRVPSRPDDSLDLGMDFLTWAKRGWVDWIVPCNYVFTTDFNLPYADWARRVKAVNPKVTIVPGTDVQIREPWPKLRLLKKEEYAVFADRVYRQGAPGVYLFNPFAHPASTGVWRSIVDEGFPPDLVAERAKGVKVPDTYDLDNSLDPEASLRKERPNKGTADRAVRGDVTVINIPWRFPDGKIDWYFNPTVVEGPFNPEWRWQLNRMDFWPEMAKAYRATRDERYARAFAAQAESWLDQTGGDPFTADWQTGRDDVFRTIEEGIRLMTNWPQAWDAFGDSPAFAGTLKERFLASMRLQAKHLMERHSTGGNWLLMEMNGVYAFASKFSAFPECAAWRRDAAKIFSDAIARQILPDGLHDELSPDYHSVAYWCALPLYETARKYGTTSDLPANYLDVLRRGVEGPIAMTTPAFTQPRFNDSYTIHLKDVLRGVHKYFPERKDFLWAATEGREGEPPKDVTASRFLPWSGYAVMRSGWDPGATYLCFDVGPLGASFFHGHQDKLSFNLYKGGEELVFEDGGGQYERSVEREYGVSGYDHNTLLVDGLAQFRRGPGRVTAPIDAQWTTTPARDSAVGVYDQGFGTNELRLAKHTRRIDFDKKADVFTVTDDVTSSDGGDHVYQLLFQLPTTKTEILDGGRRLIARYGEKVKGEGEGERWNLEICVLEGGTMTTAVAQRSPRLAGWFIGRNDRANEPATTVFVTAPKSRDCRFVTRLTPIR